MGEMRSDVDLLNCLCDEAPVVTDLVTGLPVAISRKLLARWTGVSIQTVSDYGTGKYNIPLDFWSRVLAHHFDPRIPRMLFTHCGFPVCFGMCIVSPGAERGFFKSAVAESGAYHETQKQIAELLSDGRIDELDENTIQKYDDAHARFISLSVGLHATIMRRFRAAISERSRT